MSSGWDTSTKHCLRIWDLRLFFVFQTLIDLIIRLHATYCHFGLINLLWVTNLVNLTQPDQNVKRNYSWIGVVLLCGLVCLWDWVKFTKEHSSFLRFLSGTNLRYRRRSAVWLCTFMCTACISVCVRRQRRYIRWCTQIRFKITYNLCDNRICRLSIPIQIHKTGSLDEHVFWILDFRI